MTTTWRTGVLALACALGFGMSLAQSATASADTVSNRVTPGMTIYTKTSQGREVCTAGFLVQDDITHRESLLTAGHCLPTNRVDDRVYAKDANGEPRVIGDYVRHTFQRDSTGWIDSDYAQIALASGPSTGRIAGKVAIDAVIKAEDLHAGQRACKFGAVSGQSCGTVAEVDGKDLTVNGMSVVPGDSGSPVWIADPDRGNLAAGMISNVTVVGGQAHIMLVMPALESWNLRVVGSY